jgi:mannonate dehydratase
VKITEVRVFVTCPDRNYVLVKVMTDQEGLYGVGEGTLNGSELAVAKAIEHASELLVGRDPLASEDAWQLLYHWSYWRGGPVFMAALGAIDLALWDIKGKVAGLPVYQLLGGRSREGVACYGHASGHDFAELEDDVRSFMSQGYRHIRVNLTGGYGGYGGPGMIRHQPSTQPGIPGTDYFHPAQYLASTPKMFDHLRKALGDDVELLHDIHEQLTPIEAAWLAKQLEPYRLFFLEDPLRPEDQDRFKLLREASTTPLAMGELFNHHHECLPLFQNGWIDYIRIGPIHVGGITEARKICTLADAFRIRSAFHGPSDIGPIGQSAAVHLDAAIPNFGIQEWVTFPDVTQEVMPGVCEFRDGFAYPNERPGLGVDINEEAARKYPYQRSYMPIVRRPDGSMHVY